MDTYLLEQSSCRSLKGVTPRVFELLKKCGVETLQDLLFHLPSRYEDRTRLTPLRNLRMGDHALIEGVIETSGIHQGRRKSFICRLRDASGVLSIRFFHFHAAQIKALVPGKRLRCFSEVRGWSGMPEMIHPEYQVITENTPLVLSDCLTPVYPTTEGLTQRVWRNLMEQAWCVLEKEDCSVQELLPEIILHSLKLPTLSQALHYVHRPPPHAPVAQLLEGTHPCQQRLAFEELLAHHLALRNLKKRFQSEAAPPLKIKNTYTKNFLDSLPFQLTRAQQKVYQEISEELIKLIPMTRLLQGDVGSGKTVVAALSALQAVENNYQVAFMAPTELLAEQHYFNFERWLKPLGVELIWLSGKQKGKAREKILEKLASGVAQIAVGTHALFQEDVCFQTLGLVIIDEQHRFGVHQRLALREKGVSPHQLIMTATPIPRTLAMTFYADLDTSVIDELPPGRTPVKTVAIAAARREEVIARIREACLEEKQVYWVCPLIEESEILQCQAAETTAEVLKQQLPELKIDLVHGRLSSVQKAKAMTQFKQGETNVLVATTVIEVGVDVPNASLMVIENAERLGLAQLHQLRGRVGRGAITSFCVLLYQYPLSDLAKERLKIMRETNDGFLIAKRDLELRGPGEVLGTRQAGMVNLKVANLVRDQALFPKVQEIGALLLSKHSHVIDSLLRRWVKEKERYSKV